LSALEAAVAAAVSSGAAELAAAAVVTTADGEPAGLAAARDLGGPAAPVYLAGPDGVVRQTLRAREVTSEHRAYRSGFACLVGRPNSGKSTLVNALVGDKVAITSSKPQTTRHAIRGIVHRADGQLVLVDTPGLHRPRTLLGQRLNDVVRTTWAEVDVIGLCVPADQTVGPGDRFIATEIAKVAGTPKIGIVTKSDLVPADQLAGQLTAVAELGTQVGLDWAEIVPVSAVTGDRLHLLTGLLLARMPHGPPLYPAGELTDEPEQTLVAELIREAALEGVQDELPHSIAVAVDEMLPRPDRPADRPLLDVHANLYVERDSQKAIVIGRGGSRLRDVGTRARAQIERLLGTPVFLDLHVKVAKEWQRDPKQLGKLGF
jgi:GTP-binding protein Era